MTFRLIDLSLLSIPDNITFFGPIVRFLMLHVTYVLYVLTIFIVTGI